MELSKKLLLPPWLLSTSKGTDKVYDNHIKKSQITKTNQTKNQNPQNKNAMVKIWFSTAKRR